MNHDIFFINITNSEVWHFHCNSCLRLSVLSSAVVFWNSVANGMDSDQTAIWRRDQSDLVPYCLYSS